MAESASAPGARHIVVVGGGVVGSATACYLQREGFTVTLLEPDEPGNQTSFGNLGGISPASVAPVAMPGILRNVPKMLLDPEGPLVIRAAHLPAVLPWLLQFLRAGREDRVWEISRALYTLNGPTFEAYAPLLKDAGVEHLFHRTGQLSLYPTRDSYEKDRLTVALKESTGRKVEILNSDEIRQLDPAFSPHYDVGVYIPDHGHCKNPFGLVQALAKMFVQKGGTLLKRSATGFEMAGDGFKGVRTAEGLVAGDGVVVAAGVWSKKLVRTLGYKVPLESHRGYHVTITDPGVMPRVMCLPADAKFAITPMEMGLRMGGTVELAGLDAPPNYARARILLEIGKKVLPGLKTENFTEWMGHRPCHPDSLPVIGAAPRHKGVYFAFGHGHQGLLGASQTGKAMAELIGGREVSMDLAPFRVDRF
ncbi:MAG: FAD-dependent oxidoreductase [Proteobacteria bacterium]|nr:FAD-dependent oxidoreductase [Pseudomonadota bacterium]